MASVRVREQVLQCVVPLCPCRAFWMLASFSSSCEMAYSLLAAQFFTAIGCPQLNEWALLAFSLLSPHVVHEGCKVVGCKRFSYADHRVSFLWFRFKCPVDVNVPIGSHLPTTARVFAARLPLSIAATLPIEKTVCACKAKLTIDAEGALVTTVMLR